MSMMQRIAIGGYCEAQWYKERQSALIDIYSRALPGRLEEQLKALSSGARTNAMLRAQQAAAQIFGRRKRL